MSLPPMACNGAGYHIFSACHWDPLSIEVETDKRMSVVECKNYRLVLTIPPEVFDTNCWIRTAVNSLSKDGIAQCRESLVTRICCLCLGCWITISLAVIIVGTYYVTWLLFHITGYVLSVLVSYEYECLKSATSSGNLSSQRE
jgi:hypothetical protein